MSTQPRPRLDEIDAQLIGALQRDGRLPFKRLAEQIGISEGSVRYRVQRLERAGILQIVGIADPLRIGFDFMALVGIRVEPGTARRVSEELAACPETSYVVTTTGPHDLVAEAICRDSAHFAEFLMERVHCVDGVLGTETFVILSIHKLAYGWGVGRIWSDGEGGGPRGARGSLARGDPGRPEARPGKERGSPTRRRT